MNSGISCSLFFGEDYVNLSNSAPLKATRIKSSCLFNGSDSGFLNSFHHLTKSLMKPSGSFSPVRPSAESEGLQLHSSPPPGPRLSGGALTLRVNPLPWKHHSADRRRKTWKVGGGEEEEGRQDRMDVKWRRGGQVSDSVKLSSLFSLWSVLHIFLSHWVQHWKTCWCIMPIWVGYSSRCNNKLEILAVVWVCGKLLSTKMTGQIPGFVGGGDERQIQWVCFKKEGGSGGTRGGG